MTPARRNGTHARRGSVDVAGDQTQVVPDDVSRVTNIVVSPALDPTTQGDGVGVVVARRDSGGAAAPGGAGGCGRKVQLGKTRPSAASKQHERGEERDAAMRRKHVDSHLPSHPRVEFSSESVNGPGGRRGLRRVSPASSATRGAWSLYSRTCSRGTTSQDETRAATFASR